MEEFERGQTFHHKKATNFDGQKGKYFIGLTDAEYDDDEIVCFVINTEHHMHRYTYNCNREAQKYIIAPQTFSFIKDDSAIMLGQACFYLMTEMYESDIELLDKADELFCRKIKNCIDMNSIEPIFQRVIKECYKN